MKPNDAYPSKYLKADFDVPEDGMLVLTILDIRLELIGQGKDAQNKPVIYFHETDKGLVLNKTNWKLIDQALGTDETDDWEGRKIALYSTDVQFGQDMTRGIRVSSKPPKGKTPAPTSKVVDADPKSHDDDDTPF